MITANVRNRVIADRAIALSVRCRELNNALDNADKTILHMEDANAALSASDEQKLLTSPNLTKIITQIDTAYTALQEAIDSEEIL